MSEQDSTLVRELLEAYRHTENSREGLEDNAVWLKRNIADAEERAERYKNDLATAKQALAKEKDSAKSQLIKLRRHRDDLEGILRKVRALAVPDPKCKPALPDAVRLDQIRRLVSTDDAKKERPDG